MIHYNLENCPNGLSGIYLMTFPNGKIYIGLSNNIKRRIQEHNYDKRQPLLYKAIQKYGKITEFDVLELIDANQRELLLIKEEEYIQLYHSNNKETGYNLTPGGNAYMKIYNPNALFSEADLINIKELLINTDKTNIEIAELYNCSDSTISNINVGNYYYNKDWNYPLRDEKIGLKGEKNPSSKLNNNKILQIIDLLKNSSKSMKEIANDFSLSQSAISAINQGKNWHQENIIYPIRNKKTTKGYCKISEEDINTIISLLQERKLTMTEIGKQFNCSRDIIGDINNGKGNYFKENISYPIRMRSKKG